MKIRPIYTTLLTLCLSAGAVKAAQKPNVILIMTDDQGYGDVGASGNRIIQTPHMDKLHDEGVRLTDYHAGTTCAPSRSGLMSGAEGNRAGVWHTIGGCSIMREKFTIMPQVFKANGYATAMYGKWHLGDEYPYRPVDRGFDETVVHGGGGVGQTPDFWDNDYFDDTYWHNGETEKYDGYCTDVFFGEAIQFMERKKDEPFFIYLTPNAPHGPFNVPEAYYNRYKDNLELNETQKAFYGMISNIDDNIGLLEKKLEELGIKDNTILIFSTDNGSAYGVLKDGKSRYPYNAGMKGFKGSMFEGGHRVPFYIRWKDGHVIGGYDVNELAMNYDILPTLTTLCDLHKIPGVGGDGRDLSPLMRREVKEWPRRYCVVDNNRLQQPIKWHCSSVMEDKWRLINGKALYDLNTDPGQESNIAAAHPKRVEEMRAAYERWWAYTSLDFSRYEAYQVGAKHLEESVLTAHDLHTDAFVTWDQVYIRDPYCTKTPSLGNGYWMIDVQEEGEYEIELRRWPRESGLAFNETAPPLGAESPFYDMKPAGVLLDVQKAQLDIDGLHLEKGVDRSRESISFKAYLSEGRQQLQAAFVNKEQGEFAAFYVYIRRVK